MIILKQHYAIIIASESINKLTLICALIQSCLMRSDG